MPSTRSTSLPFAPTRAAGEARLKTFQPKMGKHYATARNHDHGPGHHQDVSMLSPYLRRRMVLERNAVAAALAEHGPKDAEKFIQEVIWRSYFKGWLEHRPQVWTRYRSGLEQDLAALDLDHAVRQNVTRAEAGQTGLDFFDTWAAELVNTGYLHNHARMWFASVWIFTLGLPWRLGADFFYRHLLDGDPASNTLGWRWVAGLHTRGKPYQAQAWNIAKFTDGRFTPQESDLADNVAGLEAEEPEGLPDLQPLRSPQPPDMGQPSALLTTEEDCRVEDFDLTRFDLCTSATLSASHLRSTRGVSDKVAAFEAGALDDAAMRAPQPTVSLYAGAPSDLARWARKSGARQIITPYVPEGPLRDWLTAAQPALQDADVQLCELQRSWDRNIWPYATAGFFKVKKKIPALFAAEGLDA